MCIRLRLVVLLAGRYIFYFSTYLKSIMYYIEIVQNNCRNLDYLLPYGLVPSLRPSLVCAWPLGLGASPGPLAGKAAASCSRHPQLS
jgi:hypothetical protein